MNRKEYDRGWIANELRRAWEWIADKSVALVHLAATAVGTARMRYLNNHRGERDMSGFSFRIRFTRSPTNTLNIESPSWELPFGESEPAVVLTSRDPKSTDPKTTIKQSQTLILKSDGWASEDEAECAAQRYLEALTLSLARLRIGADFGSRSPSSGLLQFGRSMLEQRTGRRVLNDVHGLMVYRTDPSPLFAALGEVRLTRGVPKERLEEVLTYALEHPRTLSQQERISIELYNASFFQRSADARFVLLVMAVEALIEKDVPRSIVAREHVDSLIEQTETSESLSQPEKDSLLGSLGWLRYQSITQSGRHLAEERLGTRIYLDKSPAKFFAYCYGLRSSLMHGKSPFPSWMEISSAVGALEEFVSDLLSGPLLDVGPP